MPGCSVSLTTESFCSVVNRRRRATPVMTSTFENVSDIGVCLGLCLAPPANAGVRSKRGAVHGSCFKIFVRQIAHELFRQLADVRRLHHTQMVARYQMNIDRSAYAPIPSQRWLKVEFRTTALCAN